MTVDVTMSEVDHPFADRARDRSAEGERREEVEDRGPDDRLSGRQHARGDDRGNRVRGVVEAIDVVERQRDADERHDGDKSRIHRSGVLDDDAFEQVGDVFTAVGGSLEEVEDLLPLDHRDGIALLVEELDDGVLVDAVCLVFELLDACGYFQHAVAPFERVERLRDAVERLADDFDQPLRAGTDPRDLVEANHRGRRVDRIHHVVEGSGKRMDVFPVERRYKRAVEPVDDRPGTPVARVLDFLDQLHFADIGRVGRRSSV